MKNIKLNLKVDFKKVNPSIVLSIILILFLVYEVYLLYSHLYPAIITKTPSVPEANVVRVNIPNYDKTIKFLESLENFEAGDLNLTRANIFK